MPLGVSAARAHGGIPESVRLCQPEHDDAAGHTWVCQGGGHGGSLSAGPVTSKRSAQPPSPDHFDSHGSLPATGDGSRATGWIAVLRPNNPAGPTAPGPVMSGQPSRATDPPPKDTVQGLLVSSSAAARPPQQGRATNANSEDILKPGPMDATATENRVSHVFVQHTSHSTGFG